MQLGNKIDQRIIELLAVHGRLTAAELLKRIALQRPVTKQALYKQLRKLLSNETLYKSGEFFGITASWSLKLKEFSDRLTKQTLDQELLGLEHPQKWRFSKLNEMKVFWSNLITILIHKTEAQEILSWNPHPWFYLSLDQHEANFMKLLKKSNCKMYKIVGGQTALDYAAKEYWEKSSTDYFFGRSWYSRNCSTYFTIIDKFQINVKIKSQTSNQINKIYHSSKTISLSQISTLIALINEPTKVTVSLKINSPETTQHKKRFAKIFGRPLA